MLNACCHMLRSMPIKHGRTINENEHAPTIEIENVEENVRIMNEDKVKREMMFKSCTNLSIRCKKERLDEIKCMTIKIANSTPNEKEECIDQYTNAT